MNFFISGGSGFIGMHLVKLLNEMYPSANVYIIDIAHPEKQRPHTHPNKPLPDAQKVNYIYVDSDVRKPLSIDNVSVTDRDVIFNLAAIHRTPGYADHEYFDTNVPGARNICEFAERMNINRIVFTSSIDVYGADEEIKSESTVPAPYRPYGMSKLEAEKIHLAWQEKDPDKRHLLILRPGVVFGKGENGNFTRLYRSLSKRRFFYPGRKDTVKASIYVEDLVRIMLHFIYKDNEGMQLLNCCYYPASTIEEIVTTIKKVTSIKGTVLRLPGYILMPVARLAKMLGSPMGICPERVKKLCVSTNIDGKRLADTDYSFLYTFEEAVKDWYRQNDFKSLK